MDKKQWFELSVYEQNILASKYGISRSGLNNEIINDEEFNKIPNNEEPIKQSKKKTVKPVAKKTAKLGGGRRTSAKSKTGKKK